MSQIQIWARPSILAWSQYLLASFRYWLGRELLVPSGSLEDQARALFVAPFVVVSHGIEPDPMLNYGNKTALELWEMDWDQFVRTPSRMTTEPANQEERHQMLARASQQGYLEGYRGVRVSATGRRFFIIDAILWNVLDERGRYAGQAATFSKWLELS